MESPEELRQDPQFGSERRDASSAEAVGDLLRRTRESYGQDLGAVATQLRIRGSYLRAIEDGRFKDLPGSTYAVGFVRTYAEYLGLDAQEVLRRFREEVAEINGQTQLVFPAAATEGKFPGGAILMLSLVLAAVAYGSWYYTSDREANLLDLIPAVPERLMALVSGEPAPAVTVEKVTETPADPTEAGTGADETVAAPQVAADAPTPDAGPIADEAVSSGAAPAGSDTVVPAAPAQTMAEADPTGPITAPSETGAAGQTVDVPAAAAPDASQPAGTTQIPSAPQVSALPQAPGAPAAAGADPSATVPSPQSQADPVAPSAAAGTETAGAAIPAAPTVPAAADAGQTFGAANTESRIVLHARLESWVQVTDAEDTPLLTRVLRAGDNYQVPNQPGLTLATGNAGGLDILVDGRTVPSLGPVGVVRRNVVLDPERLLSGTALPQ